MGMLDLFRGWQFFNLGKNRPRRRTYLTRTETLEVRQMLSPVSLVGTTLSVNAATNAPITLTNDVSGITVTVDSANYNYAPAVSITAINVVTGTGNDQVTIASDFTGIAVNVQGNGGIDTLVGPNLVNTWDITGPDSGILNGQVTFSGIANLVGSSQNDSFVFDGGFVMGTINGGAGTNSLDYSNETSGVSINLQAGISTGIGLGFNAISNVIGSSGTDDVLIGPNAANTWNITGADSGNVNGTVNFVGFENLDGGTSTDVFKFMGGYVEGTINGAAGVNTLDYSGATVGAAVNLATGRSTGIGTTAISIANVVGSSTNSNTLMGPNTANTWNVTGHNSGNINGQVTFSTFQNLVGGNSTDAFVITPAGSVDGNVSGGIGSNTLDYSGRTDKITLSFLAGTSTAIGGQFSQIQNLIGSSYANNILIGANLNTTWDVTGANSGDQNGSFFFTGFQNLTGGRANDAFNFVSGGFISGVVDGLNGTNTLNYSQSSSNGVNVNLQTGTATGIGTSFRSMNYVVGTGKASDKLIGINNSNVWNISAPNGGTVTDTVPALNPTFVTVTYSNIANIVGGTGADVFHLMNGGSVSGSINGGATVAGSAINNWLDYSAISTGISANLLTGVGSGVASFSNIQNVHGSIGASTLIGNTLGNVLVGGGSTDTITAGTGRSVVIGGAGNDVVKGGAAQDIVIGGFTDFDLNFTALSSILSEWQSSNTFAVRISHLRTGGGLNGTNDLVSDGTVHSDAGVNTIYGGAGPNWLFGQPFEFKDKTAQDVTNTPILSPPVLTVPAQTIYSIQKGPVVVDSGIVITDQLKNTLSSAKISISSNFVPSQDSLSFAGNFATGNILGSYNAATGVLTLTSQNATATVAQFQAALQLVTYNNSSATPNTTTRSITFTVNDGLSDSNPLVSTVSFNLSPVLAGTSAVTYVPGSAPLIINSGILATDDDNATLASATVTISRFYQPGEDVLGFIGNAFTGSIVGNFNAATGVLTLTSAGLPATIAQYQAALRLVTYVDISATPFILPRSIAYQVSDGSTSSNVVTSQVNIAIVP